MTGARPSTAMASTPRIRPLEVATAQLLSAGQVAVSVQAVAKELVE